MTVSMKPTLALPIDDFLPDITKALASSNNLVVTAAPGAGKTTRLPPALLHFLSGKILVLEPRRMAAIAAAHRIAEENGWTLGQEVGYQVRFGNKTSKQTRLIFMTEALLARQMISDPELEGVDAVVLDEFHERSLHVDLALGLLRELQELGRKIHIIVMSATLEAEKISSYLGQAPIFSVPGKLHELKTVYQKNSQLLQTHSNFYDQLLTLTREAQAQTKHDLLIFLPGVGEIERARQHLTPWAESKGLDLVPLHGSLPLEDQRRALQRGVKSRVVLSTNIAESSVTVDGVNTVIDSGLAKVMKQDLRTGFSRLEISRISQSSAIQRSGRAARQFPGMSYRMWNKLDESSFSKSDVPEILRSDLSESLLFLAAQGVRDFDTFSWFEKPAKQSLERALKLLRSSGALSEKNEVTSIGQQILHFPLPVRLARLMIAGAEIGALDLAARIAALLQERDILRKEAVGQFIGDELECDLTARLEVLEAFLKSGKARDAHMSALQTVSQSYRQILSLAKEIFPKARSTASLTPVEARQHLLMSAYRDRLCRRRKHSDRALMSGGRGVKLSPDSLVRKSEFFFALSGVEGSSDAETLVSLGSGLDSDFLFSHFAVQIQKRRRVIFDEDRSQFYREEFKSLDDLPLEEPTLSQASPAEVGEQLPEILAQNFARVLKENEELSLWVNRLNFLYRHRDQIPEKTHVEVGPELSDIFSDGSEISFDFKMKSLSGASMGETKMAPVFAKDLVYFFEDSLSQELRQVLRAELPARLKVPSGSMILVHYPADKAPYMEMRIQEIFGWTQTPKVLFQLLPITLHLLSPNFRPVQVTSSLESFWQNGYAEVRQELRIRYPKHQWPEDPKDGVAEAKGKRRQ
jgi:ATP-dependent helicase HrpB